LKKKKLITILLHLLIWVSLYYIFIRNVKMIGVIEHSHPYFSIAVFISSIFNATLFYGVSSYILPKLAKGLSALRAIGWCILILLGFSFVETALDYTFFLNSNDTSTNDYIGQLISNSIVNFFVMTIGASFGLLKIWRKSEKQKEDLSKETLRAELDFLKAQVNPHFLFNVLNMAYSSASKNDDQETAGIIEELANMMRYMLYESNVSKISLEKEIEYLQSFVNLQKKRLSSEVSPNIEFKIEGAIEKYQIAPLLLIPFVENAFKHGIRMGNETFIKIQLSVQNNTLLFEVKNSISKNSNELETQYGGVGLENVKKRLELLYPNQYQLIIQEEEKQYYVTLKLNI
jgi:two-component system, LytTR family, sensor kinase